MAALGALSQAWTTVEAALPPGWQITGLNREPHDEGWVAVAVGPQPEHHRATGYGQFHYQAPNNLAIKLRELRGPANGL
jgi:hypothetical protein